MRGNELSMYGAGVVLGALGVAWVGHWDWIVYSGSAVFVLGIVLAAWQRWRMWYNTSRDDHQQRP